MIDALPHTQLPRIKALLEALVHHNQTAVAELQALVETGYPRGTEDRSPYRDRDELHDR